jgi:hypothetical protein
MRTIHELTTNRGNDSDAYVKVAAEFGFEDTSAGADFLSSHMTSEVA